MKVLRSQRLATNEKLDPEDFIRVVRGLREANWVGAVQEARARFAELAGLPDVVDAAELMLETRSRLERYRTADARAEVFFADDSIYYVLVTHEFGMVELSDGELYRIGSRSGPQLEIGIVSSHATAVASFSLLCQFGVAVQSAILARVDGRKTRHMRLEWFVPRPPASNIERLRTRLADEDITFSFAAPDLQESLIYGATQLADSETRRLLVEVSKAGFAREADVIAMRTTGEDETRSRVAVLAEAGLISASYLIQCRQTSRQLARLDSPDQLAGDAGALTCSACSRAFKDELLIEGYQTTDLAQQLLRGSHWMTVWVTVRLVELGVPVDSVLWNVSESSEEVDVVVDFRGLLWILELKDRTFDSGDAHPLNYRQVRYDADKAVIVTTDSVSSDAKRVFEELIAAAPHLGDRDREVPIYVEKLESFVGVMRSQFELAALLDVSASLAGPSALTGYDLPRLLRHRA